MRVVDPMRHLSIVVLLTLSFGVARCDWTDDPTLTDQLMEVGQRVPAYGGVSWNGSDQPTVFVQDSDSIASARETLVHIFGRSTGTAIDIEVKADPPVGSLHNWRERLTFVFSVNGVVGLGLHSHGKYVGIWTATAEAVTRLEDALRAADYPSAAVIITVVGYPREH